MKLQLMVLLAAMTFAGTTAAQELDDDPFGFDAIAAKDLEPERIKPNERVNLFDSLEKPSKSARGSYADKKKMTVAELRQARALYRSQQRIQRLEMYQWLGYEPLRPNWATIPSMTSRYQNRTIYVPVYYYGR